jgi:hypothetical protein
MSNHQPVISNNLELGESGRKSWENYSVKYRTYFRSLADSFLSVNM